ncbi:MAG TPA: DNA polymerase/3'-5' exonuclease PolX [Thermoanaerobaculia bacterium]|nr:DNA polymerase/3'-5' exonuclease PolX [Thermoanaerobaculia bacterium]
MDRKDVARVLEDIAGMLELKGSNPFKVKAYENGAKAVLSFPGNLQEAVASRELLKVPGIGPSLFANIETLVTTGSLPYHEELRARFPPGLRECLRIPGVGARRVKQLHDAVGIDSIESLEKICLEGKLAGIKGFGSKSAERILRGIAMLRATAGLHRYTRARRRADEVLDVLDGTGLAGKLQIAGSLRRRKEIVRDLDFVASSSDPEALGAAFRGLPWVSEVVADGPTKTSVRFADGLAADLRVVSEEDFPAALQYFTGSQEHNTLLRGRAKKMGLKLNEYGLFRIGPPEERVPAASEAEIYRALGLDSIEPELREGLGEIEAAERGELPRLVSESDLKGVIHVHTTESDGRDTLEVMISAARDAGYTYAAVTDHSKTAGYAGGLSEERVLAQREEIRALQRQLPDFRIFHGTEADILADGSIDYGDEFLANFDLVVASVHSRFGLPRAEQTARLVAAVRNPRVAVLGHPTGRLLLSREGLDVDVEAVIDAAAESGCALEINGSPERLDLDWRHCRKAAEKGVLFSIDPDAHSTREYAYVSLGVGIARKGWVTPKATLNARTADQLEAWLVKRRGSPLLR